MIPPYQNIRQREEDLSPPSATAPPHCPGKDPRRFGKREVQVFLVELVQLPTVLSRATGGTEMATEEAWRRGTPRPGEGMQSHVRETPCTREQWKGHTAQCCYMCQG